MRNLGDISFNVFYPSLSYTSFKTEPAMTFAGLLSNLGGSLGLIVSVSVFTLFEIVELFGSCVIYDQLVMTNSIGHNTKITLPCI